MRLIEKKMVDAFKAGRAFKRSGHGATEVCLSGSVFLYGYRIVEKGAASPDGAVWIRYDKHYGLSRVTKSRLNGILSLYGWRVYHRNFNVYLSRIDGSLVLPWDGTWILLSKGTEAPEFVF